MRKNLSKSITAGALAGVFMLTGGSAAFATTGGNNPTDEGLQEMLDAIGGGTESGSNGSGSNSDTNTGGSANNGSQGNTGASNSGSVEVDGYYEAETDHIRVESEQTTYPLAPGENAYWYLDVSSITGEPATAYTDLEVEGTFGYTLTVVDTISGEVLYSAHSSDIDGVIQLHEFELTTGANYVTQVTADRDAPQNQNILMEKTITAQGESVTVPPKPPETPETPDEPNEPGTPDEPGVPDEPETPERPDRPVPPELEEPREPVETTTREIPTTERNEATTTTPPVDEEDPEGLLIESGYINENPGVFWGAVFSAFAGLVLIGFGAARIIRNRSASANTVDNENSAGGAK